MAETYYKSRHTGAEIDDAIDNYADLKNARDQAVEAAESAASSAASVASAVNAIETMSSFTVYLLPQNWQGSTAPYTQTVTTDSNYRPLTFIKDSDVCDTPIPSPIDYESIAGFERQFRLVKIVSTINGGLVFVCPEKKPEMVLPVTIKLINWR